MRTIIDYFLEKILLAVVSIMMISVIWQVVSRYLLGSPSTLTDEIASFSLIWLGLYGAAYASGKQLHLAIDLIPEAIVDKSPIFFSSIITLATLAFALGVMVIGGGNLCWVTFELQQQSAALSIPLYWIYSAVPISGLLIVFYSLDSFLQEFINPNSVEDELH